ncbi:MAG: response regulator, partial [Chitinivibrionales bacterium]|nr:response regulator [Chitinivibrionales bacterium]
MRELSECTVMVVEDTEENVDIIVDTLGDSYEVTVAMDGKSALEDISVNKPDLILLDIMMPEMDGYEVCSRLKENEETREIPVLFLTAMSQEEDETKGLALGAIDYITKPIRPPIIKSRVKNHLELVLAREDLRKQNEILSENIRLRDEVERISRHDLKSPLQAVISVPSMLLKDLTLSNRQKEMIQMIEKSGYRMLEIINSSLDLFKMETGKYELHAVPVDIISVLGQIKGELETLARPKGIALDILFNNRTIQESNTFTVPGEEMLCYSMLANIIKNAIEASPEDRHVVVNCDADQGPVVTIHNDGTIPEKIRDTFFEKYATSGKKGGTGLGTYSAMLIAKTMG